MRSQVSRLAPTYSYRAATEAGAFAQFRLLSADEFGRNCKAREIRLGFGSGLRERLEELDQVGALSPVLFERGPRGSINDGAVPSDPVFRDETPFTAWDQLQRPTGDPVDPGDAAWPRYSRWQLLYAWDAVDLSGLRVSLDDLLAPGGFAPTGQAEAWCRSQLEAHHSLDDRWRGVVLLLTRLQGRFGPYVKGGLGRLTSTTVWDPETGEMVDPWAAEVQGFDAEAVLAELSLTAEQVREAHRQVAMRALWEDPLERWHPLTRMAPHSQRNKLKGRALRAQDGYDAAEILRRFYFDLTSELLPEADEFTDLSDGGWRRRLYGDAWPTLRLNHNHLVAQLRQLRLWPLQVHLVLEGVSEDVAAREIFAAVLGDVDLASAGISITNLRGVGELRRQKAVFSLAKSAVSWTLLVCDREGEAVRDVERLQAEGLVDPETTVIWKRSFEEDNFADEELVEELRGMGSDHGVTLAIIASDVRAAYEERRRRTSGEGQGFAEFLLGRIADPEVGPLRAKKRDLAARLARRMLNDLRELGQEEACERRPFLAQMLAVLRVT